MLAYQLRRLTVGVCGTAVREMVLALWLVVECVGLRLRLNRWVGGRGESQRVGVAGVGRWALGWWWLVAHSA